MASSRSWTAPTPIRGRAGSAATRTPAKKPVVLFRSDFRGSGDADDIPYNAMLIGAADAHIELRLGTVDEAAAAIDAELAKLGG